MSLIKCNQDKIFRLLFFLTSSFILFCTYKEISETYTVVIRGLVNLFCRNTTLTSLIVKGRPRKTLWLNEGVRLKVNKMFFEIHWVFTTEILDTKHQAWSNPIISLIMVYTWHLHVHVSNLKQHLSRAVIPVK